MGDYSVENSSLDKGKVAYNEQKEKTFDSTKFDGVDEQVEPNITPLANLTAEQMPPKIEPLPLDQMRITIPIYPIDTANAGKTVKQSDGKYYQYDEDGRVKYIYDTEADKNENKNKIKIVYDNNGNIEIYKKATYDEQGHCTDVIEYDSNGYFSIRAVMDQFNENYPKQHVRQTLYYADGSIAWIFDNSKYDEQGRIVSYDSFNPDGSWDSLVWHDYSNDGNARVRNYFVEEYQAI